DYYYSTYAGSGTFIF
nr:immunoglobulin light chain junction region [Macaca mulatta]